MQKAKLENFMINIVAPYFR